MPVSRDVDELVDRAVARWRAEGTAATEIGRPLPERRQRPMIAVSRDVGSGGAEVAHLAGAALGFEVYDRDLVHRIAETANARELLVEALDERVQDRISNWILTLFEHDHMADGEYLRGLLQVLIALGQHGRGVIVGRGAAYALDPQRTLRVRLFAPVAARVERVARRESISIDEARRRVLERDADRDAFVRHYFARDPREAEDFDLLLNTAALPLPTAAEIVTCAFRARFGGG